MMRYLTLDEILDLQRDLIDKVGGSHGIRDMNAVDSAVAQPQQTMFGEDLYPTLAEKAAALGYSLVANHGFVDGNKRVGWAGTRTFLLLNGYVVSGTTDEKEAAVLAVASGRMERAEFARWLADRMAHLPDEPHG